jgi:hypothetical protein
MTKENDMADKTGPSSDTGAAVSHRRRRLLKGTAISAPVLLTLRSVSVAASSSILHGYTSPTGQVSGELSVDPEFIRINRSTSLFSDEEGTPIEVVNAGVNDTCDPSRWFQVIRDVGGNVTSIPNVSMDYTGSCSGGIPGDGATIIFEGVEHTYSTGTGHGTVALVVGIDPTSVGGTGKMTVTSVGPTSQNVMLASVSSWTSLGVSSLDFNNWPST